MAMVVRCAALWSRLRVVGLVGVLIAGALAAIGMLASPAQADTAPDPGTPQTVSADALPTVQQNGVVWAQVTVGNTVYATGSFSQTWPAGTTQGAAGTAARANLLAFDITTGNLITSFNHSLNAQGLVISASPDGSRVYVGGDFTSVDGVTRNHIAAFDTATGALDTSFHPSISGEVEGIAATNSAVYTGGNFFSAAGVTRTRLAAFASSNGALLSWAPTADDNFVTAMVMAPDQSRVIVGGRFKTLNGVNAYGLGSLDATTGATLPFAINQTVQDYGTQCGINSLSADNNQIYGSGFAFGCGNFEGTFAADPDTGNTVWVNDCHGDTYSTFSTGSILYSVSHAHECSAIGDFPDTNPRVWHHALAETTNATGTNVGPDDYGWNFNGVPDSTLLHWYPALGLGKVTGQSQAAWSVTGNSKYVALGGEFPTANGKAQVGLVRYAIPSVAPDKVGPVGTPSITPTVVSLASGSARLAWTATWDYDNENLTYNVLRDGSNTPIATLTQKSNFWTLPSMGYVDKGLTPGSTHTYRIQVVDPNGNKIGSSTSNTVTISSAAQSAYATDVSADGASDYWRLGEPSGTTAYDWTGFSDLTLGSDVTRGATGAIAGDTDAATTFNGSSNGTASTNGLIAGPNTFTIESWIKTTTNQGGKIVGFGNAGLGGTSGNYDRHVYMDNSGHVIFGVYNNGTYTITSPNTYNDGQYHQIVATLSSAGMALYIDGKKIGINQGTTVGQNYSGYWRVGGDNLDGWPSGPSSRYFAGTIDDVAIYPTALSLSNVQQHYVDSGRSIAVKAAPTDAYGKAVFNDNPDMYLRLDDSSDTDSSANGNDGQTAGGVSFGTSSPVTTIGKAATFNGVDGTIASKNQFVGPSVYSEELWFNTTTTHGGKLIGFGDQQSGRSGNYDRHVYMENSGQLTFGVWTGFTNTITSTKSYNDGNWHYMVATQGPDGMTLYVDGQAVGTNPQTAAQAYNGYWRIGGDSDWGGDSPFFAGSIDEAAVYSSELTPAQVLAHMNASPAAPNQAPTAAFTSNCTNLSCSFDAGTSNDPDGSIASYAWDFGDGHTDTGATPTHSFDSANDYSVKLTVTDNKNATGSVTHTVTATAPPANQPPTAAFTSNCTNLSCSFDAGTSNDPDGSIASYAWDFGDGHTDTGATPTHSFDSANDYSVKLTVTDNKNATGSVTHTVTVTAPANQPPTAAFTPTCTNLDCAFDAGDSTDTDGSVASYAWDFGDGTTGSGKTATHTFPAAGDYTVQLTVTDNQGATGSITHTVSPRPADNPPTAPFASDAFNRSKTGGWGTADTGGNWTIVGSASNFSVANGSGNVKLAAGAGPEAVLNSVSQTDSDSRVTFGMDSVGSPGNGNFLVLVGRRISTNNEYRGQVRILPDNSVHLKLYKLAGSGTNVAIGNEITVPGLTYSAGMLIDVRLEVTGTSPTTLRAKVWQHGTTEPAAWQLTGTDSTAALQAAGSVGIYTYLAGTATNGPVTVSVASYSARPTVAPPTASFTTSSNGLTVSVDGSGSSDPSGSISSYTWSWGDGKLTSGVTSSHAFAQAGTYRITLTVTDASGWTDVTTRTVTIP